MKRYRSKPTEVMAVQWRGDNVEEIDATPAPVVWGVTVDEDPSLRLLAGVEGAQEWVPVPEGHWIVWDPAADAEDYWPVADAYFKAKYVEAGTVEVGIGSIISDVEVEGEEWGLGPAIITGETDHGQWLVRPHPDSINGGYLRVEKDDVGPDKQWRMT